MEQKNLFCLWTGGKSACFALYRAIKTGQGKLFCMIAPLFRQETSQNFHLLPTSVLRAQADLLQSPLLFFSSSFEEYNANFKNLLDQLKKYSIHGGIFGDVESAVQKEWGIELCLSQNMAAYFPLWHSSRESLFLEFLDMGFSAKIVAVNEKYLTRDFLGRDLDKSLLSEFASRKVDVFGAFGEYHTVVYNGPLFSKKLELREGDVNLKNGYWTLDVLLASSRFQS